jgi:hypothetical protein
VGVCGTGFSMCWWVGGGGVGGVGRHSQCVAVWIQHSKVCVWGGGVETSVCCVVLRAKVCVGLLGAKVQLIGLVF